MEKTFARSHIAAFMSLNPKVLSRFSAVVERRLARLFSVTLKKIDDLSALATDNFDLIFIDAQSLPEDELAGWIDRLYEKVKGTQIIWTPAVIFSQYSERSLLDLAAKSLAMNWHFDLVSADHLDSLPIRVANLLRIHEHLKELLRYHDLLTELQSKMDTLERSARAMGRRTDPQ